MKIYLTCLLFCLSIPVVAFAADPLKVAPEMYSLLFENDEVRVMTVVFKPGQKIAEHSHPVHYVVVEKPGKLKISKPDGSSTVVDLKTNQVLWLPAETHWAENVGDSEVQLVVNELKNSKHKPVS